MSQQVLSPWYASTEFDPQIDTPIPYAAAETHERPSVKARRERRRRKREQKREQRAKVQTPKPVFFRHEGVTDEYA